MKASAEGPLGVCQQFCVNSVEAKVNEGAD